MLQNPPGVSVIIPTHNRCDLIQRAVQSAAQQTYHPLEILVISDGSTDDTETIVNAMAAGDNRIRYFRLDHATGANAARNLGIQNARYPYTAFLDDDDVWHPDKIEKQMQIIRDDPAIGFVCTGIRSIRLPQEAYGKFIPSVRYDASEQILQYNAVGSTTTVLVKKELFAQCGLFDQQLGAMQDYDMWIRLCQRTKTGVVKEACVDYYIFSNEDQISKHTERYILAYERIEEKYRQQMHRLSKKQQRSRKANVYLFLAKRGFRNRELGIAREYTRKTLRIGKRLQALCLLAVLLLPETLAMRCLDLADGNTHIRCVKKRKPA